MIKKLMLITATLMATSIWSEVTYLKCERFETEYKSFEVNFVVDTEKGTIKFGVSEQEYWESGTSIGFVTEIGTTRWEWTLDRVSGELMKVVVDAYNPNNKKLVSTEEYKCTRTDPLF